MAGDFQALAKRQQSLILKPQAGLIAVAGEEIELLADFKLTTGGVGAAAIELTDLSDYVQLGWVSKNDGFTFSSDTETEDVESFGSVEPTRTDIVRDVTTAQFTPQETNRIVLEMYYNVDLSALTPAANTGEVGFNQAVEPVTTYRRMIFLSKDGRPGNEIYMAKIMPRASVTAKADQQHGAGAELSYGMTVTAKVDDELGYSVRNVFGGAGWKKQLIKMGFPAAPTSP